MNESKHFATLRTPFERAEWTKKHHARYPWGKYEKEEKKTRDAVLAAAGLEALVGNFNKRMLSRLSYAQSLYKKANDTKIQAEKTMLIRKFNAAVEDMKKDLGTSYLQSYRLGLKSCGLGSRFAAAKSITKEEQRWVTSAVNHELKFLRGMLATLAAGVALHKLSQRAKMYGHALKSMFFAGQVSGMSPDTVVDWVVDPAAEHCEDCVFLSQNGPYVADSLPTTPGAGLCRCLSHCRCKIVFRVVGEQIADKVRKGSRSKESLLAAIQRAQQRRSKPV